MLADGCCLYDLPTSAHKLWEFKREKCFKIFKTLLPRVVLSPSCLCSFVHAQMAFTGPAQACVHFLPWSTVTWVWTGRLAEGWGSCRGWGLQGGSFPSSQPNLPSPALKTNNGSHLRGFSSPVFRAQLIGYSWARPPIDGGMGGNLIAF